MHYTPTYSSWLNQVENWFARIQRDLITRGVFTSIKDLDKKLMHCVRQYNKDPKPLKWTFADPTRRITSDLSDSVGKQAVEEPRHSPDHLTREMPVVVCLSFSGRYVADGREQSMVVEPGDPFERGQLDSLLGLPRRASMDQPSLVQTVHRLGQGVVVAVALAAQRGLDAGFGQAFAVPDADVLGGFNRSLQHLTQGGARWDDRRGGYHGGQGEHRCDRQAVLKSIKG